MGIGELPENEFLLISNFFENDDLKKNAHKRFISRAGAYTMGNPLYATVAKSVFPTISKLMSDSFEKEVAKQCLDAT